MRKAYVVNRDTFWSIIENAREVSNGECDDQASVVQATLRAMPADEILSFGDILDELLIESYSKALWTACGLINGGCTNDDFEDFRGWLITQGRLVYDQALQDPDSLGSLPKVVNRQDAWKQPLHCQAILAAHWEPYEDLTGQPPPLLPREKQLVDGEWNATEEEIRRRFPRLSAKFLPA
jgi:hypothetical protein